MNPGFLFCVRERHASRIVTSAYAGVQKSPSQTITPSFESRLWLPKFDRYLGMDDRKQLLQDANVLAHWVEVPPALAVQKFCRDADDDKFIHVALAAEAPWLVTGDKDLLQVPALPRLRILSPAAALRLSEFHA